jgi:hypothetical protein
MVPIAMAIRPLVVEQNFNFEVMHFLTIADKHAIWILSYQIAVFGMFLRLAGLVALGTLHRQTPARTVLWPGVAICGAALLVNTLSSGYYMHMGFWGAAELKTATDAMRQAFLVNIRPVSELMICLERMGKMFLSFGLVVLGAGLMLGKAVPKWLGLAGLLIGAAGMGTLFIFPFSSVAFIPFDIAIAGWLVVLGVVVFGGIKEVEEA